MSLRSSGYAWNSPAVDLDRLIQAMEVLKMARLEYMGTRRQRRGPDAPARTGQDWIDRDTAIRKALWQMRCGGVNVGRIPDEAMALLEDAHTPRERDHAAKGGSRSRFTGPMRGRT